MEEVNFMEERILELLYAVLIGIGEEDLASKIWKFRKSTKATIIEELSLAERTSTTKAARWLATAKLALHGSSQHLGELEKEALRQTAYPTE
jgi:hypothetical protein